jgi:hypothetical protein
MNSYNKTEDTSLEFLLDQLNQTNWKNSYKLTVIKEYEKFLYLRSQNNKTSPSNDVDIVWHQHILNTKHYREYCNNKFGFFVDHDPTDAFDQVAREPRLINTVNEYTKKFGVLNPQVWKEATSLKLANKQTIKQNKKLIWYDDKRLYDEYKQGKQVLKIIFSIEGGSVYYTGATIMYLTRNDITLAKLAEIVDERLESSHVQKITKDATKSYRSTTNNKRNLNISGSRHIVDMEPDDTLISYYYDNRIELIAHYAFPNEGC